MSLITENWWRFYLKQIAKIRGRVRLTTQKSRAHTKWYWSSWWWWVKSFKVFAAWREFESDRVVIWPFGPGRESGSRTTESNWRLGRLRRRSEPGSVRVRRFVRPQHAAPRTTVPLSHCTSRRPDYQLGLRKWFRVDRWISKVSNKILNMCLTTEINVGTMEWRMKNENAATSHLFDVVCERKIMKSRWRNRGASSKNGENDSRSQ